MSYELRAELNVIREPFCVMHFRLFYRFGNVRIFLERLWLGFDKGFDKRWKSYGSIIVTKQISNGT